MIERGVLYCSGLIAGEGLVGILLAVLAIVPIGAVTLGDKIDLSEILNLGNIGGLAAFALLIGSLFLFAKRKAK